MTDLYSAEAQERRDKFNRIINSIDMVLINNIAEVDTSIWENWQDKIPMSEECDIEEYEDYEEEENPSKYHCNTHDVDTNEEYECEDYEGDSEVYQWYAVNQSDAEYLARHNQYITYSDMLDTYFLAICHYGTSWDYVDSMVNDILGESK